MVLATRRAGSDLPYLSPSHLSPLPVSVHTHSLNLQKPNLAPTYFFVTHARRKSGRGVGLLASSVCVCVCLSVCSVEKKPLEVLTSNLTSC